MFTIFNDSKTSAGVVAVAPNNFSGFYSDRRSGEGRRSQISKRSAKEVLMNGKGRFKRPSEIANIISTAGEDVVSNRKETSTDRGSGSERRSDTDRRCGFDSRSEIERFLQGERRSGLDRRSRFKDGYQSFKKARAFVRSLKLKSIHEWRDYTDSDMKPKSIPADPQIIYANDGWAGWNDWLGAGGVATHLSQYRSFEKARAFVRGLGLLSDSKWRVYSKSAKKPDDIPANPKSTYADSGWISWDDWLGYKRKRET
jgi:hypothetical protein